MDNFCIGIIGGGQLAKMLIEAGLKWGPNLRFHVLDQSADSICAGLAERILHGSLHDTKMIQELARNCDVVTYELEDISLEAVKSLEYKFKYGIEIPRAHVLYTIKDKGRQKGFYIRNKIPTAKFGIATANGLDEATLSQALDQIPGTRIVLKQCVGGYDGRGVQIMNKTDLKQITETIQNWGECVIEEYIANATELSVIVAVNRNRGDTAVYPVTEMVFTDQNVLDYQLCPARISAEHAAAAMNIAQKAVKALASPGLFAVEMFLTPTGQILVNEIAPRPHNSGHHTIEANYCSQFEQLLRILLPNTPLGNTEMRSSSLLVNLLGPPDYTGEYTVANLEQLHATKDTFLHLYGKKPSKPGRKLGHVTVLNVDDPNTILPAIKQAAAIIPLTESSHSETPTPLVGVIMGSRSDLPVMQGAIDILTEFGITHEVKIVSAHRTPDLMYKYAKTAATRGLQVIIAGAGGAAHLPGMTASLTTLPVIGVPVKSSNMSGLDSLYSIVQMPSGVPVATMAINGASNGALLAIKILATTNPALQLKLQDYSRKLGEKALANI